MDGVPAASDCDDEDPGQYPGAEEWCSGEDDDCDGEIDEEQDFQTWYLDEDRDGYGTGEGSETCDGPPEGYVALDGDCDDGSAEVFPGTIGCGIETDGESCLTILDMEESRGSGVYFLLDPSHSEGGFEAYCDMETDGGGWTLAFKQSGYSSSDVDPSDAMKGDSRLLDEAFGSTTPNSLFGLPHSEMLYKNNDTQWFITPGFDAYEHWAGANRYCLYRGVTPFRDSPDWSLWDDAAIEIYDDSEPSISAIMIGRNNLDQFGTHCKQPHCSTDRHGRYNGSCQNSSRGIGDWMIFVR